MRIFDLQKIEELYRDGKISKSTWWRGKKRGWIDYGYHSIQPINKERKITDEEIEKAYWWLGGYAWHFASTWGVNYTALQMADDLAGDALVYCLEKKPNNMQHLLAMGTKRIKQLARRDSRYRKYFYTTAITEKPLPKLSLFDNKYLD